MKLDPIKEIMLIDDDEATNYLSKFIIDKKKCCENLSMYSLAEEALEHLSDRIRTNKNLPDVIFLDLNMPRLNGWEFLEKFSELELSHTQVQPTIIVLSTSMNPEDREKADQISLVSKFLQKPLSESTLNEVMSIRHREVSHR